MSANDKNDADASTPEPLPGDVESAQPGLRADADPDAVRRTLETSRGIVPQPLKSIVLHEGEPPAVFVDAADGINTYAGFNGDKRSREARDWTIGRLEQQRKQFPS